jgi:hypothetical protein
MGDVPVMIQKRLDARIKTCLTTKVHPDNTPRDGGSQSNAGNENIFPGDRQRFPFQGDTTYEFCQEIIYNAVCIASIEVGEELGTREIIINIRLTSRVIP